MESALLWYQLYTEKLQEMGFKLNPKQKCIANKQINGKQCALAWYVGDNELSHEDLEVITKVIKEIESY